LAPYGIVQNLVEEVGSWACETGTMKPSALVLGTLEGYSVEGGYDRVHEPASIYSPTISLGRHPGPGDGAGLWTDYEQLLDQVGPLGLDGICLTPEWTRIEPRQGHLDEQALTRYRDVAAYAKTRGLHVTIKLVDQVWPAWLGMEAWLMPWVGPCFIEHAKRVMSVLCDVSDSLIVFGDGEGLVQRGFLEETAPPWRRGAKEDALSALEHVQALEHELRSDSTLGPKVVPTFTTIRSDQPDELQRLLQADEFSEIHIATLVRGSGPVASTTGMLSRRDGVWGPSVDRALVEVLATR
jgi:beta-glucosidase/6-phospho-beta-glucosidase/beta-galactosidase